MVSGRESEQGIFGGYTQAALQQQGIARDLPGARFHRKYIKPGGGRRYTQDVLSADVIKKEHLKDDGFIEDGTVVGVTANRTELTHYDVQPEGDSWIYVRDMDGLPVFRKKALQKRDWR